MPAQTRWPKKIQCRKTELRRRNKKPVVRPWRRRKPTATAHQILLSACPPMNQWKWSQSRTSLPLALDLPLLEPRTPAEQTLTEANPPRKNCEKRSEKQLLECAFFWVPVDWTQNMCARRDLGVLPPWAERHICPVTNKRRRGLHTSVPRIVQGRHPRRTCMFETNCQSQWPQYFWGGGGGVCCCRSWWWVRGEHKKAHLYRVFPTRVAPVIVVGGAARATHRHIPHTPARTVHHTAW
mmetsp:Transcript_17358/g.50675  ORF Transcript_17358/g.50675 Transcript_17358/m.50675 type:complete len:238 (-) Transcript_17358:219-932(-)